MEQFDPKALDQLLARFGRPAVDTAEEILDLLPPTRRYLGPGAWYRFVDATQKEEHEPR